MAFDIEGARAAGYSDDEIADHLATQRNFDIGAARKAGYGTPDIMAHLSDAWAKKPLPQGVQPSAAGAGRGAGGMTLAMAEEAQAKPARARRTLADVEAGPSGALASIRENERARTQRLAPASPLDQPDPNAEAQPSLIDRRGAPVSEQAFAELQSRLGAMPRAQRQALESDPRAPAWMRSAAAKLNPQLDASTEGAQRLEMPGQTVDSRAQFLVGQGMRGDTAASLAQGQASRGERTQALAQATPMRDGLLTPDEEQSAQREGAEVSRSGIAQRGLFAAGEGLVGGTAGVMAAALRAMGDDEAASVYEKVGQAAEVRANAANELRQMQARARDAGMQPSGPLSDLAGYADRMSVGAANSIGQMAPGLAAGLTGAGGVGMALMVAPVFGQSYIAARESGKTPGAAAAYAAPMAGLEWVGERYGLLPAAMKALREKAETKSIEELPRWAARAVAALEQKGLFSKPVGAVVRTQAGEQIGEQITAAGQYLIDGTEFGLDKPISLVGFLENARDTAVQTLLATGAIQAAGYGVKGVVDQVRGDRDAAAAPAPAPVTGASVLPDLGELRRVHNDMQAAGLPAGTYTPEQMAAAGITPAGAAAADVPLEDDGTGLADNAPVLASPVDERAHAAATSPTNERPEPTQAQKEAGNYAKGHVRIAGMDLAIENPQGSVRRGVDPDGNAWENTLQSHYGYIKGTLGNDKDHVDAFIKPGTPEDYRGPAFVIDQVDPKTGKFDEHKVVLGVRTEEEARALYQANYADGWQGLAAITKLPMGAFKSWVRDGAKKAPLGDLDEQVTAPASVPALETVQPQAPDATGPAAQPAGPGAAGVPAEPGAGAVQAPGLKPAAKRRAPGRSVNPETDTLLQAVAKLGGVNRDALAREFGLKPEELKATVKAGNLKAFPFRNDGMAVDRAIEALQQDGYFDGVAPDDLRSTFEAAIFDELGGNGRLSTRGQMRRAEQLGAEEAAATQAELDAENEGEASAEREAIIAAEAALSPEEIDALSDDDIPDLYAAASGTPESLMRALGFTEQEIADEIGRGSQEPANDGAAEDRNDAAGAAQAGDRGPGRQEGRDAARGDGRAGLESDDGREGRSEQGDGDLTLSSPSAQDLRDAAERADGAAAADAAQQKRLADRAKADAQRDEFTLTGSDRPADVAAAGGQQDIFSAAPAPAPKPAAAPPAKKLTKAQEAKQRAERFADYFTPGNIVRSYGGGFDEVLSLKPTGADGSAWSVRVHEVREVDGKWVRVGKPQDARSHSTYPEERLLRNGPRARLQPVPGDQVQYTEPRADGRPFPDAPDRGTVPAAQPEADTPPAGDTGKNAAEEKAKQDLKDALGDLADILSKPARKNMMPEQEQRLLPVLTRVFDAAFRLGYLKFKDAAKFALDQIRSALGAEAADSITLDHLQGAYIGMAGRYRDQGAERPAAVAAIETKAEIEAYQRGDTQEKESPDAPTTDADLERDSQRAQAEAPALAAPVRAQKRRDADGAGQARGGDRRADEGPGSDAGLPADGASSGRERGDLAVRGSAAGARPAGQSPGVDDDQRGGGLGDKGVQPDAVAGVQAAPAADAGARLAGKLKAQRQADAIAVQPANLENIRDTLPFLLPGQHEDVHKAEQRFDQPDGYGMLFTNQPGTGKTFTGLGLVKRMARQGKTDTIIVAPSDKVIEDWINSGKSLGLSISKLDDTKTAGRGIVITTYANFGQNDALARREWGLVVVDESHYLMQEKDGTETSALRTLRAITRHPRGALHRAEMLHGDLISNARALSTEAEQLRKSDDQRDWTQAAVIERRAGEAWAKYEAARDKVVADVKAKQGAARTRVAMLSATPFAYEKTIDYADGYLFDYDEGQADQGSSGYSQSRGYNGGDNRERFFMQHFGYRMRYNKLTAPDSQVDRGLMQRQFNGWLKKRGSLSGRMLEVEPDYDRRFILVDSAIGTRIDEALDWISEQSQEHSRQKKEGANGFSALADVINKKFDYLNRRYLLEAIKASEVLQHVRDHMAMGRKVVVFHDYKKGGGFNPFDVGALSEEVGEDRDPAAAAAYNAARDDFRGEFKDLIAFPFSTMPSPIALFQREFPEVLLFNGDVKPADRRAAVAKFQDDESGPALILVQSAAGKEGISLHDTTGKHQRVLFNLGQPTQPTTAIQQEGRTYRTGQVSNSIVRYLNTGTNWEKWAFATTIAERASAAENLGMGEQARALKDAFIAAFEESGDFPAGHDGEGTGGKSRDRAANEAITEYDRARSFYWGTQKKDSRTKAKEGTDYFATPEPVGLKLVQWLDLRPGEDAAEPSAGHGAIARWLPENITRTAVEPSSVLRARLAMVFDGKIIASDFEDLHAVNKFDGIAMNPPFGSGGRTAVDHLAKASQHLREGGRVAAIIPTGPAADKKFEAWLYAEDAKGKPVHADLHLVADIKMPSVTFERAGTGVMTRIVVIDRLGKDQEAPRQLTRDYTSIEDINELFDRLEDAEIPKRTKPQATGEEEAARLEQAAAAKPASEFRAARALQKQADAVRAEEGAALAQQAGMKIVEHVTKGGHGKTLRGVVRTDLTQAQAKLVDEFTFKKDGGWFIREKHIAAMNTQFPIPGEPRLSIASGATAGNSNAYERSTDPDALRVVAQVQRIVDGATRRPGEQPVIPVDGTDVSPELRSARALARGIFGHKVVFVQQPKGQLFYGMVNPDGNEVLIDVNAPLPVMAVLGHELLHRLRVARPEVYDALKTRLDKVMSSTTAYADRLNASRAKKGLPPLSADILAEERIADVVGDQFTDTVFWRKMAKTEPVGFRAVGEAILSFIDDVLAKITKRRPFGSVDYIKDLREARAAVVDAMAEFARGETQGGTPPDAEPRFAVPNHTPEEAEALARAGLGGKPGVKIRLKQAYGRALDLVKSRNELANEFRQGALDQFHGIQLAVERELGALPVEQDPYVAARLANGGTSSVMRGLLLHGQAQWAANTQHLEKVPGTKGLLEILAPLGDDTNDFFGWMVGNRAARLMKEGREHNLTADQIKTLQGLAKGRRAEFVKIAGEYSAFKRSVLDVAEKAGLIDPVGRKAWDHADYIPFYRKLDEQATYSPTGKRGLAGQSSGIRTLRGSTAALNDPLENLLMNYSRLIDASIKNNAIAKTIATLEGAGSEVVEPVGYDMGGEVIPAGQVKKLLIAAGTPEDVLDAIPPEAFEGMAKMWAIKAPTDPDVVRVMVGGKPKFYRVSDPLLLRSLTSFVPFDFPGLGAARAFKRLLTAMVTSTPDFMVRNFIRDSVAAGAIARDGFNPAKSITGIAKSFKEAGGFESMLFAGASFQSGNVNAADPTGTAVAVRRALRSKGMDASSVNAYMASLIDTPAKFWEKYRHVGESIENANREAVFEAADKAGRGVTAAAYEAKDLMDFSLRGSWPAYQLLADVLPFFNARVQGLYRLGRADPQRLVKVGLMLTAASMMLAFANDGEDWYEELPDWDKDTNWHFRINGHHFRIPKPFEIGVIFATIPERIGRAIKGLDAGKKTAGRLWANVRDQLAFDPVPQMFRPALNVAMNHDNFRDAPIETIGDEGKLPSSRYNSRTSDTMRVLAQASAPLADATGMSPKRLEYLVGGYLGTVGLYALGASDMLVRELEGRPPGPELRADDLPLIKSFYRVDPARSTVYESDLYNMREELQKIAKTVKAYAREGDLAKVAELTRENREKLAVEPVVTSATRGLAAMNKARDAIVAHPTMSPREKRERIDALQLQKNALAKRVMTAEAVKAAQ